ncbi:MAG: class I SAM-dependent methyltransferase [Pseudomonadota bacterium]
MTAPTLSWSEVTACRACLATDLRPLADFGATPLSDKLGTLPESEQLAPRVPLELVWCSGCRLPQLSVNVAPEAIYDADYPYYSSVSPHLSAHFAALAAETLVHLNRRPDAKELRVLEAASNDGYLLRHFAAGGATVLGFDPSSGPASVAQSKGIETKTEFFGLNAARSLVRERGTFDLFLANNVLAHVPDLRGFVAAIAHVLRPGGMAVIEVPYLADLVEGRAFDTIYHQHLCYFPLISLARLFEDFGLGIILVTPQTVHGGSIRLRIVKGASTSETVSKMVRAETESDRNTFEFVQTVAQLADTVKTDLRNLLAKLMRDGGRIWAYGAAAKGNTLLSFCGLGHDQIEAVADLNTHKHGLYMPGSDLRITSPEEMKAAAPSHVLILAWNFREEILQQLEPLRASGTRFIIPVPHVEIV